MKTIKAKKKVVKKKVTKKVEVQELTLKQADLWKLEVLTQRMNIERAELATLEQEFVNKKLERELLEHRIVNIKRALQTKDQHHTAIAKERRTTKDNITLKYKLKTDKWGYHPLTGEIIIEAPKTLN